MSNISTIVILIVMLIIIMIIFFIYYRKEKDFKKAAALLALIILTTTLGILADEIVRRTNREPGNQNISAENETITTTNDVDVSESDNIDNKSDNKIKTVKDFLYFISPMARRFFINRTVKNPPEWFLLLSSIVSSIVIFIAVIIVSRFKPFGKIVLNIIKGLVMSFINFYIIFFIASAVSWIFSDGIALSIVGYYFMSTIVICFIGLAYNVLGIQV